MPVSKAQLKSNKKYHAKFDTIVTRVPRGEKEVIQQFAAQSGESLNGFVRRAIREAMERAGNPAAPLKQKTASDI